MDCESPGDSSSIAFLPKSSSSSMTPYAYTSLFSVNLPERAQQVPSCRYSGATYPGVPGNSMLSAFCASFAVTARPKPFSWGKWQKRNLQENVRRLQISMDHRRATMLV